ncbi:PAS domain-containing sensor histidine kinase [Lysobacter pythonis]|uniref:histidine kinase n=1 Tax=Solilutibacter pythonis TaxID=2483112 RepID=A0A3M2HIA9_9GAMM|nr:ATP-binding protein [Lysobacter pythonis]RMH88125.1 PAS domain-containing sensor histidine kinase [Lysobacter pythonis]
MPDAATAAIPAPDPDQLATPLVWCDGAGLIIGCNPAFARWLGVGRRRLLGQPLASLEAQGERLSALLRGDPADAPPRLRRLAMAVPGVTEARFADLWLAAWPGGWWVEAHPVDEFAGNEAGSLLPAAVAAALKGLAHELRNPLAGIKGAAQLLARKRADAVSAELTALIQSEVDRLAALLDRLMSPRPAHPHTPLNLHLVLDRVLRLAESDAGWAVRLVRDYDPSLPEMTGDGDRLTQAVWNLVRNAIEAGAASVAIRTRAEHGVRIADQVHALALRLDIVDDGRGIPDELAEQVFLPLVSGRAEGSGLGLALAQQVAREHRGALSFRSRPGHTVFTLLLPLPDEENIDG